MKKVKKILALILSLTFVITMFAGCDKKDTSKSATANKDTVTLTVYTQLANNQDIQTGWFGQLMLEKFNVQLLIVPEGDGAYATRMESGNLGDIVVWGADGDDYKNAIKAGLLLDWEEDDLLADYGPDILERFSYALEKNRNLNPDGKIHGFGHAVSASSKDHQSFMYSWDLRWDLYDQLGRPEFNTLDDYIALFEQMKAICPTDDNGAETYAFSLWPDWDGSMVMYVKAMVTAFYGYDEHCLGNYDPDTGDFYACLDPKGPYVEMLKFFNKLYQKGLLDPDSMTQTYSEMSEKMQAGGVFASIFNYAGSECYNTEEHISANKIMTAVAPGDACPIVYGQSTLGGNRVWSIGAKTEYPELCMEIIDWLCTPEGFMEYTYGPKGVTWDYDENGNTYFTEFGKLLRSDDSVDFSQHSNYSGTWIDGMEAINNVTFAVDALNPDSNGETFNYVNWKSEATEPRNDAEAAWRDWAGALSVDGYMEGRNKYKVQMQTTYTDSPKDDELKVKWNQVTKCITDGSWKCIYAKNDNEFEYLLKQMTSSAVGYGYDECIAWSLDNANTKHALEEEMRIK